MGCDSRTNPMGKRKKKKKKVSCMVFNNLMILYIILTQCEPNFFDCEKDWLGVSFSFSFSVVGKWIDWELRQHKKF